jgi:xanthine/uracil permease
MALGLGWKVKDAAEVAAGGVVAPDERLSWGKTVGLGAQHVVAMFGATFVFPLIMGLNAQLAIMMSGIATIIFLLIVQGKVPSYLGTSASFVGAVAAIRAQPGLDDADVTGAILVAGLVLAAVGLLIHVAGPSSSTRCCRRSSPVRSSCSSASTSPRSSRTSTGRRTSGSPSSTMLFTIVVAVAFRGFIGRISIFLALIFGTCCLAARHLRARSPPSSAAPPRPPSTCGGTPPAR